MDTRRALRIAAAILAALTLLVAGLTGALNSQDSGPQPGRSSWGATHTATPATPLPTATPPPLAGAEHEDLSEPGDVDLGSLRGAPRSSDTLPGCVSRFNTHNFSSRNGAAIRIIAAHYTVSANVPGWADVNANADWLNRSSTANPPGPSASATLIIDAEGNCLYTVPLNLKAWTEAAGNPFTAGIEFVATGNEGKLSKAAVAKGGQVIAAIAKREHIKIQLGDVTNCVPHREGLVDHAMYGRCGGGHHDLRPLYGTSVVPRSSDDAIALGPLIAAARTAGVTATDRVTCRRLNWWRSHGRPHGAAETNAVRRRRALTSRGVTCTRSGPVLTG